MVRLITPIMQAGTNTRRSPDTVAARNAAQPTQFAAAAPVAAFQRIFRVSETASGLSSRPSGPAGDQQGFRRRARLEMLHGDDEKEGRRGSFEHAGGDRAAHFELEGAVPALTGLR